ncbi:MAG: Dabb family protein [Vicinamibacterales bacterium]
MVLFAPKVSPSAAERRAVLEAVTAAVTRCPTVRGCRVGRRVLHGLPGYEQSMREDYEYALLLDFDDVEGLRAYLNHPAHSRLDEVFASAAASLAYDYEFLGLDEASRQG